MTYDLTLFDLSAGAHRAWHAANGSPLDALVLLQLDLEAAQRSCSRLVVAVDAADSRAQRQATYPEYKASRKAPTPALAAFLEDVQELPASLLVEAFAAPRLEADDVVATLTAREAGTILIWHCTTDELQLISERIHGYWRAKWPELVDPAWVKRRFGVEPIDMPLMQALAGDASDGIPGVLGVGPVRAARIVRARGVAVLEPADQALVERNLRLTTLEKAATLVSV